MITHYCSMFIHSHSLDVSSEIYFWNLILRSSTWIETCLIVSWTWKIWIWILIKTFSEKKNIKNTGLHLKRFWKKLWSRIQWSPFNFRPRTESSVWQSDSVPPPVFGPFRLLTRPFTRTLHPFGPFRSKRSRAQLRASARVTSLIELEKSVWITTSKD